MRSWNFETVCEDSQGNASTRISVKLTGSSRKVDIVDRLISMAKIGAVRDVSADSEQDNNATGISYITDQVKTVL